MSLAYFSYDFSYYLFVRNISYLFEGGIKNDEGSFEESSMKYKRPILLHKKKWMEKTQRQPRNLKWGGNSLHKLYRSPLGGTISIRICQDRIPTEGGKHGPWQINDPNDNDQISKHLYSLSSYEDWNPWLCNILYLISPNHCKRKNKDVLYDGS